MTHDESTDRQKKWHTVGGDAPKKTKKTPAYIIILHLCTKNLDDMIYSSWGIEHDRLKSVILGHFFAFLLP